MAFLFQQTVDGGWIDWGNGPGSIFNVTGDLSFCCWLNFTPVGLPLADFLFAENNSFFGLDPFVVSRAEDPIAGFGARFAHVIGGGGDQGVTCIPGLVDPSKAISAGVWLFFAVVRDSVAKTYTSYFGTGGGLTAGPVGHYTNAPASADGPFELGLPSHGEYIGPFAYWDRKLNTTELLAAANCNPDTTDLHLLLWCRMNTNPPVDLGPYAQQPHLHGGPQTFVSDAGCASFFTGQNYTIQET